MRCFVAIVCAVALTGGVVWAGRETPVAQVNGALAALDGFAATYTAESSSGTSFTIRVRYRAPNKMRYDVEPLGVVTLFDGERYIYYDREQKRAIVMQAAEVQAELQKQHTNFAAVSWFGAGKSVDTGAMIHPNFVLGFSPQHMDIALEMSTKANAHSWVQDLERADDVARDGNAFTLSKPGSQGRIRLRVSAATGMLLRAEMGEVGDVVGTIELTEFSREAPDDTAFVFPVPSSVETRDHLGDPSLLQQLLVTSFRGTLDRVLTTATTKWDGLDQAQKGELRAACLASFHQVFAVGRDQTLAGIAKTLKSGSFAEQVKTAATDATNKGRFAADNPLLTGTALDDAWRDQIVSESTRAVLFDLMRAIDAQFVGPIREQAAEAVAGLSDDGRKEIARLVTEPILQAFTEMARPTVEKTIREILAS